MITISANDAKQNFGRVIDDALQSPVSVTKNGRPSVVILSDSEYQTYLKNQHERLQQEVSLGFEQFERGEVSELTADQVAEQVLQRYLNKEDVA